jgi:hypothetical protein
MAEAWVVVFSCPKVKSHAPQTQEQMITKLQENSVEGGRRGEFCELSPHFFLL